MTQVLHLSAPFQESDKHLSSLAGCMRQLIGEPFLFARFTYGDELTLHFGVSVPAKSPKLATKRYGTFILGTRASFWLVKSGIRPDLVFSDDRTDFSQEPSSVLQSLNKQELESNPPFEPGSRVVAAIPFGVAKSSAIAVRFEFSDGTHFVLLPDLTPESENGDEPSPSISDWELSSPSGHLKVGPGFHWEFKPRS